MYRALLGGEWIVGTVLPSVRRALSNKLSSQLSRPISEHTPISFLSSAYYRGTTECLPAQCVGKELKNAPIKIVDRDICFEPNFWKNAARVAVAENAALGRADSKTIQIIDGAIMQVMNSTLQLADIFNFIQFFVLYRGSKWIASTQPHYLGSIFLSMESIKRNDLAENVVHELAHQELFCINVLDRLVVPSSDGKMYFAPFQKRKRPTIGRLHSAHALFRTCEFLHATQRNSREKIILLEETIKTFEANDLTPFGNFLVNEVYKKFICKLKEKSFEYGT